MIKDYGRSEIPDDYNGPTWDTQSLQEEFTVNSFAAPFVGVTRKSDGRRGLLEFIHHPRVYFDSTGEFAPMTEGDLSLRPRPGETAEEAVERVINAARTEGMREAMEAKPEGDDA